MKTKQIFLSVIFLSLFITSAFATATPTPICGVLGVDWTASTRNAAFGNRHLQSAVVKDGYLWVIGGADILL